MNLHQYLQLQGMRKRAKFFKSFGLQRSGNQKNRIGPDRFGLHDLVFINDEVLSENRAKIESPCDREIFIASAKELLVGQDR